MADRKVARNSLAVAVSMTALACMLLLVGPQSRAQVDPYSGGTPSTSPSTITPGPSESPSESPSVTPSESPSVLPTLISGGSTPGDEVLGEQIHNPDAPPAVLPEVTEEAPATLPFTGAQVTLFTVIGLGAIAIGIFLLRRSRVTQE